jgi:hypothetical protein
VNDSDILSYDEEENVEGYRKKILEKDYSQCFSTNVIKNIGIEISDIPQQITDFRKIFIKKNIVIRKRL